MKLVIVSDTHLAERAVEFCANWELVHRWIRREAPDLVVHLGDISAAGDSHPDDLKAAADLLSPLTCPLLALPGNHDVGDNPSPQSVSSGLPQDEQFISERSVQVYRTLFGEDYWSINIPGWQLIGLNAQLFGSRLAAERIQRQWLLNELAHGAGRVGVMLHKPLYRNGPDDGAVHPRYLPLGERQWLLEQLGQREIGFIVSGHTHQTRRHMAREIEHVWAPSTAFYIPDHMQEPIGDKVVGAMILNLAPDHYAFRLAVPDGLRQNDIINHGHVYPSVANLKRELAQ